MYQIQVSFTQAIQMAFQRYCCFVGRSSRSEYWWYALFTFILGTILGIIGNEYLVGIVQLALILPGLGLCARRLHDIGKSAWYILLCLIPLVGAIILIVWFCKESQPFDNQYGPVPNVVEK